MKVQRLVPWTIALMLATACVGYREGVSGGEVDIDPADAAKTVVLQVKNQYTTSIALSTIVDGQSRFIGSVAASDSTAILLDPSILPTGFLYISGILPTGFL